MNTTYTPIMRATGLADSDAVVALLAAGADPNELGPIGRTALHWAVEFKRADITETLLDAGADPNHRDRNGWTGLMVAAQFGRTYVNNL